MCDPQETPATLYDGASGRRVARVMLQHFYIASAPAEGSRILRSFRLLEETFKGAVPTEPLVRAREGWQAVARVVSWPTPERPGQLQFV